MDSLDRATDIEARRMELRGVVRLAGEVIAQYWPMRTFVHHNPLHSLEYLPFEETVRRGKQFMGGSGYLPSTLYYHYLRSGRIRPEHLDQVLGLLADDKCVAIGARTVTHGDVLRACLTQELVLPVVEPLDSLLPDPSHALIEQIAASHDWAFDRSGDSSSRAQVVAARTAHCRDAIVRAGPRGVRRDGRFSRRDG